MARPPRPFEDDEAAPAGGAEGPPNRDAHPAFDLHFLLLEVGKLGQATERLIKDVDGQGTKIDELRQQATTIQAWIAASTFFVSLIIVIVGFFLSSKGNAILNALQTMSK